MPNRFNRLLLSCAAISLTLSPSLMAQNPRALITQAVDESKLSTLAGNTRPETKTGTDLGKVADSFSMDHMMLQLKRSPDQEQALQAFVDHQHDSSSPNFHKWLTADEFGKAWGTAPADIEKITKWLRSRGFTVNNVYPSGMVIDFSGTAAHVAAAFHTEIHNLSVNGVNHIANMSDPQIPSALAPAVNGIVSLHDFRPKSMVKKRPNYTVTTSNGTFQIVTPADLATIYDFGPAFAAGITGQGQTIAVVEDSDLFSASDWTTFRSTFGLSTYTGATLNTVHPTPASGRNNCADPGVTTDDSESIIDAEWASAAAPSAAIVVATCANTTTTDGLLVAIQNLVNQKTPPQIISVSYGSCEVFNGSASNAAYNSIFQQAVSQGISAFVSTGDAGPATCDGINGASIASLGIGVNPYASTPYTVAVGGTDFADTYRGTTKTYWSNTNSATYGSALSYIPEIPWNDSCAGSLLAGYNHYNVAYGSSGFCGSAAAQDPNTGYVILGGGGGGPSSCATGDSSANGLVSGTCAGYPKPSWQTGIAGIPNDGVRDLPDVAMFAADGVWNHILVACFSDANNGGFTCTGAPINWFTAGGTSFAAPIMAGIQALVNQKMGASQGNPNPVYYKLAASSVGPSIFHAITMGDTVQVCAGTVNCFGNGFEGRGRSAAGTPFLANGALSTTNGSYSPAFSANTNGGYNLATGLGSVDAYNLITNWSKGQ